MNVIEMVIALVFAVGFFVRCAQGNPGQPEEIVTYRLGLSRRNAGLPTSRRRRRFTARVTCAVSIRPENKFGARMGVNE